MPVETLPQFYERMRSTRPLRQAAVAAILGGREAPAEAAPFLRGALAELEAIPADSEGQRLRVEEAGTAAVHVDLGYEIGELQKDIRYLEEGEEALLSGLARRHSRFLDEVAAGGEALAGVRFQTFVSDRDGTVNNYCGRYASSIQSAWNAAFLSRFARARSRRSVILTSAPLDDGGLVDLVVTPPRTFLYAGSKGREYLDPEGQRRQYPIDARRQEMLGILNRRLGAVLDEPGHEVFRLIGSGLQHKFGQTTVARQDIHHSVPEARSKAFLESVRALVRSLDPEGAFFRIEDTGLDVELLLTVEDERGGRRDFDKGDGVRFLNDDQTLAMDRGPCLVCGDTSSDVPMLEAALELAPAVRSVFVTRRDDLRERVRSLLPGALFVSEPDALVAILNALAREG
jgi:Trehalose-6-phosphate phosphatase, C-terminal/Trehalose-6-phosphate phosphatase N-terminal helical bundle domain